MSGLVKPDANWFFAQLTVNRRDDEDGCSYWMAELHEGYPTHDIAGIRFSVHRFVAAVWWGPAAVADRDVHHLCEHKTCINPRHLVPLTTADHARVHGGTLKAAGRDMPVAECNLGECLAVSQSRPSKSKRPTRAQRVERQRTRELVLLGLLANQKPIRALRNSAHTRRGQLSSFATSCLYPEGVSADPDVNDGAPLSMEAEVAS